MGAPVKLVVREGRDHGWPDMGRDLELFADWFEQLRTRNPAPR